MILHLISFREWNFEHFRECILSVHVERESREILSYNNDKLVEW